MNEKVKQKNILFFLIIILLLPINLANAQKTFEGKIGIIISSKKQTITMNYFVKENNLKPEIGNSKETGSFIKNKETYLVLMPTQKIHFKIDSKLLKNVSGIKPKTNNKKKVEAWVTNELDNFMTIDSPIGKSYLPSWSSYLKNNGFFPILAITSTKSGRNSKFEVINITKTFLNDSEFTPPSDYKKMNLPEINFKRDYNE